MAARKSKLGSTKARQIDAAQKAAGLVGADAFVELLNDRWRFAWLNFRAGLYRGIGLTIGVALIVVLLGWAVAVFGGIPYIGDFITQVQQSVQQSQSK